MKIRYIDGNNNAYEIDATRLEYVPVTPAQSSSGMYSGGEPKAAAITGEQHAALAALCDRILADTPTHLATRPKGCGTIVRTAGVRDETRVSFSSPLKDELERLLKAALRGA